MYPKTTSCGEIGKILHEVLEKILGFKNNGIFVEVGANDGKTGSFTYNLAEIGWSGLYLEPIPDLYNKCFENHKFHKNIIVENIAAGEKEDILPIKIGNTLSTMDNETKNVYDNLKWAKNCFTGEIINVKVDKLNNILNKNNISNIDLLIIDVEGFEENVLKGFDIKKYNPKIVIIEIADQHPDFINNQNIMNKFKKLRNYFNENNYKLVVNDIVDNIYVLNENYNKDFRNYFSKKIKFSQFS